MITISTIRLVLICAGCVLGGMILGAAALIWFECRCKAYEDSLDD